MSFVHISNQARTAVYNFISNGTVGFNPTLATISTNYSVSPFAIDFSPGSKNFFQGYYGAKDLAETSNMKFPVICLYTVKSANTNAEKFHLFSGSVMIGIDTYISFPQSAALSNTENLVDAVEDTYYNVFHAVANQPLWGTVTYNGDLFINRGPLAQRGSNWLQLMQARLTFDYNAG